MIMHLNVCVLSQEPAEFATDASVSPFEVFGNNLIEENEQIKQILSIRPSTGQSTNQSTINQSVSPSMHPFNELYGAITS
jgi:hypothetical protein